MPSRFQHANQSNSEGRKCPPPRADSAAPEHDVISAEAVLRALLAEVVGTFVLTFVAAGGVVIGALSEGAVSAASRAVAPGLVVLALIYAIGNDSGAHYNPSVTLAFALRRAFQWRWVTPYWAAQVIGAVAAALLLRMLFGTAKDIGATHPHYGTTVALVMEIVLTFLLVLVILGTATRYSAGGRCDNRLRGPFCRPGERRLHEPGAITWTSSGQWRGERPVGLPSRPICRCGARRCRDGDSPSNAPSLGKRGGTRRTPGDEYQSEC
jgi:hypothetical protein